MNMEPAELLLFAGRAAVLIIAFAAFAFAFGRWRRAARDDTRRLSAELEQTRLALAAAAQDVRQLVADFDELKTRLAAQAKQAAAAAGGAVPRGYDVAIRLARSGATPDELIATSGVTREEARLLTRLHGRNEESHDTGDALRATA